MHEYHSQSQIPIMDPVLSQDKSLFYKGYYHKEAELGTGKFGSVYNASLNYAQMMQGTSEIKKRSDVVVKTSTEGKERYLINEIKMLKEIPAHDNIIQFIGASLNNKFCFLEKGLAGFARRTSDYEIFKQMPLSIQFAIFHNMLTSHMHLLKHNIKNMDVHLMNWLVGYDGHIKMIDFGDAYNMFNVPIEHIERYKAKMTTKDPIVQIDILTRRLSRDKVRNLIITLTRAVDLSYKQSLLIYFINGGSQPEEYKENFFRLHKKYTRRREEKFLKHFNETQKHHNANMLAHVNAQIIKELEKVLQSDYIWNKKACPEQVRTYFLTLKNTNSEFYAANL